LFKKITDTTSFLDRGGLVRNGESIYAGKVSVAIWQATALKVM
jgi:hypothetical protein